MLLTKLHIPPAGNNIVHRSELYEKLNTGLNRKLILISAPVGLQLKALSMQGREDISEFIQDLKGENRYIMDYLIEEVLKIQPK
jgi:ATP/maltotriose-dependent transcriptional regulator MalT